MTKQDWHLCKTNKQTKKKKKKKIKRFGLQSFIMTAVLYSQMDSTTW